MEASGRASLSLELLGRAQELQREVAQKGEALRRRELELEDARRGWDAQVAELVTQLDQKNEQVRELEKLLKKSRNFELMRDLEGRVAVAEQRTMLRRDKHAASNISLRPPALTANRSAKHIPPARESADFAEEGGAGRREAARQAGAAELQNVVAELQQSLREEEAARREGEERERQAGEQAERAQRKAGQLRARVAELEQAQEKLLEEIDRGRALQREAAEEREKTVRELTRRVSSTGQQEECSRHLQEARELREALAQAQSRLERAHKTVEELRAALGEGEANFAAQLEALRAENGKLRARFDEAVARNKRFVELVERQRKERAELDEAQREKSERRRADFELRIESLEKELLTARSALARHLPSGGPADSQADLNALEMESLHAVELNSARAEERSVGEAAAADPADGPARAGLQEEVDELLAKLRAKTEEAASLRRQLIDARESLDRDALEQQLNALQLALKHAQQSAAVAAENAKREAATWRKRHDDLFEEFVVFKLGQAELMVERDTNEVALKRHIKKLETHVSIYEQEISNHNHRVDRKG